MAVMRWRLRLLFLLLAAATGAAPLTGAAAEGPPEAPGDRSHASRSAATPSPPPPGSRAAPLPHGVTLLGRAPEVEERVVVRVPRPDRAGPADAEAATIGPGPASQLAVLEGTLAEPGPAAPPWSRWTPEESLERTDPEAPYPWHRVRWAPLPSWFEWRPTDDLVHTSPDRPYPWNVVEWPQTGVPWRWHPEAGR
ncbi:MAG: hypothetical protein D6718_03910 [Acidobacteria bacterium]|nr:MAG: hypothetical protein D6718_03910 [Acidobacteriota bacterium]